MDNEKTILKVTVRQVKDKLDFDFHLAGDLTPAEIEQFVIMNLGFIEALDKKYNFFNLDPKFN